MDTQENYQNYPVDETTLRLNDIEEKQRILKDQLLLIGKNLLEIKEDTNQKIIEIKKDLEILKNSFERVVSFIETISAEIPKFAKKEDVEILAKQAKMFQPLSDLK